MNTMMHKGYAARVEYSEEDGCFVGHIAGIRDVIGFHGESVTELRAAFEEAVDDYLETCEKLGQPPNHPYSGQFRLRLSPELHARAAMAAETRGKSLNAWVSEVIERGVATA
ncbi:MAG: type II toxin-antitoxin system HicB family antitoxin [Proteobacteria bacterium]|nr:type II toxin-antitoxin system HicB family antitoxin [Pseudomonadota bacterium]MCL2308248.1 type II toxin-antitoxin system HicB family antitoxin [Pseudomonadota bacterium]